jgi:hypothetical protein
VLALLVLASLCALQGEPDPVRPLSRRSKTFGTILGAAGDFDADGVPDFVVGAVGYGWENQAPSLWVVSGRNSSVLCIPTLPLMSPAMFGAHGGSDADGDGVPDILLTAKRWEENAPDTLRILSGTTSATSTGIRLGGQPLFSNAEGLDYAFWDARGEGGTARLIASGKSPF